MSELTAKITHLRERIEKIIPLKRERPIHQSAKLPDSLAGAIDHTLLKADASADAFDKLCAEAIEHQFGAVCVNGSRVELVKAELRGAPVRVAAVVGFPLGSSSTIIKSLEAREAIACGASEIDMVINVGALKDKDYWFVYSDIERVVQAVGDDCVKVILETCLLTEEEKIAACLLSVAAGADFVKTSTGFSNGGATEEDIALMRAVVGNEIGVKASGGVRDRATAEAMIRAGATRLGTSSGVTIITGGTASAGKY